jgi:hypothetical protein
MAKPRIMIVTYNWPPRNAIGTHRPYSWAKYWSRSGVEVTVLTAKKYGFDEPLDLSSPPLDNVEVIEIPYLRISGASSAILKQRAFFSYAKRFKNFLNRSMGSNIDPRHKWLHAALPTANRLAKKYDVVVSTFGPASCHLICCEMKKENPSLRWIADYRDLWSLHYKAYTSKKQQENATCLELETVGTYSDALTTVSGDLARQLAELLNLNTYVITNGFDLSFDEVKKNITTSRMKLTKPIRVLYAGKIYPGSQDPLPLLDTLNTMKNKGSIRANDITVDFYGAQTEPVHKLAQNPIYSPFIRIMGHISRDHILKLQKESHLLLLLESSDPQAQGVLTGKVFEYIVSGTPILSLGSMPGSAIYDLLNECKCGFCAGNNITLIEQVISDIMIGDTPRWFNPSLEAIMQYSRKRQAEKMLDILLNSLSQ